MFSALSLRPLAFDDPSLVLSTPAGAVVLLILLRSSVIVSPPLAPTWNVPRVVAVEQVLVAELGLRADRVQLRVQVLDLGLDRGERAGVLGAGVRGLHDERAHALQDVLHGAEGAVGDLRDVGGVLGVGHGLGQTVDLAGQALADRQAGRVVGGLVDAQARGQLTERVLQLGLVRRQVVVRVERGDVGVDAKTHGVCLPNVSLRGESCPGSGRRSIRGSTVWCGWFWWCYRPRPAEIKRRTRPTTNAGPTAAASGSPAGRSWPGPAPRSPRR